MMSRHKNTTALTLVLAGGFALTGQAVSSQQGLPDYNTYGIPGLIDMPSALQRPDGELAFTTSTFGGQTRNSITFQMLPRLTGSFRYSKLEGLGNLGPDEDSTYDRSFSLEYQIVDEGDIRPAVAIGLNDFLGTGIYSSEYVVATKTLGESVTVTGGLGWGRLAGVGGFDNPLGFLGDEFDTRPARDAGQGGTVETDGWFRGDAAFFGGVTWQATPKLRFVVEYSSDAYTRETDNDAFDRKSDFNYGLTYQLRPGITLSLAHMYGSEIGGGVSIVFNPKTPPNGPGLDPAPLPVNVPGADTLAAATWDLDRSGRQGAVPDTAAALETQGVRLHGLRIEGETAIVDIENESYAITTQAIGRTARVLTHTLPASVKTFTIRPVESGMVASSVTLRRSDLAKLEDNVDGQWSSYARARIDGAQGPLSPLSDRYPSGSWQLRPYLEPSLFDPDNPIRLDAGVELSAEYEPAPGFLLQGAVRKKLAGNLDTATRESDSVLPRVRSDFALYDEEGDPKITNLTANYFFKPSEDLYGRISVGYLEPMFGGISTELLWKPVDSRIALGAEINHVKQRDYDQLFGFQDYEVTTGHASVYWDMGNGFHTQVDAGKYLAGDWGGTIAVDREFRNGFKVGAFATFTDVSYDDFGPKARSTRASGSRCRFPGWRASRRATPTRRRSARSSGTAGPGSTRRTGFMKRCATPISRNCATIGGGSGNDAPDLDPCRRCPVPFCLRAGGRRSDALYLGHRQRHPPRNARRPTDEPGTGRVAQAGRIPARPRCDGHADPDPDVGRPGDVAHARPVHGDPARRDPDRDPGPGRRHDVGGIRARSVGPAQRTGCQLRPHLRFPRRGEPDRVPRLCLRNAARGHGWQPAAHVGNLQQSQPADSQHVLAQRVR